MRLQDLQQHGDNTTFEWWAHGDALTLAQARLKDEVVVFWIDRDRPTSRCEAGNFQHAYIQNGVLHVQLRIRHQGLTVVIPLSDAAAPRLYSRVQRLLGLAAQRRVPRHPMLGREVLLPVSGQAPLTGRVRFVGEATTPDGTEKRLHVMDEHGKPWYGLSASSVTLAQPRRATGPAEASAPAACRKS